MYNSQVPGRGKVAKWLEDFVNTMSGKKDDESVVDENIKTADINVQDLPKVVWNDETFYVLFDNEKGTAKLYNRFSNEVTTIENVNSIEEVDKHLNSKQVVTSESDNELEKVTEADMNDGNPDPLQNPAYPNADPIDPNQQPTQDPNNPNPNIDTTQQPTVTASVEDYEDYDYATINSIIQKNFDSEAYYVGQSDEYVRFFVAGEKLNLKEAIELVNSLEEYINAPDTKEIEDTALDISEDIEKVGEKLDYMKRIADLEEQVKGLVNTIEELKGQFYARQDPGPIYDSNTMAEEVKHIEETSKATADQITQDNATDITTMNGRVSLVDRLRQDLKPIIEIDEEAPEAEEVVETEKSVETDIEVDNKVEPKIEEVTEEPVIEDITTEDEEEDEEKEEDTKKGIINLSIKDSKIFKKAICPCCGDDGLTKAAQIGSYVGVYCKGCTAEYAVNVDTEDIFIKN